MTKILELDEDGEAMWRDVTALWDDQSRHDRFVHHCFAVGRLAAAGARYRAWIDANASEGSAPSASPAASSGAAIAHRMQQRLRVLSVQALAPTSRRLVPRRLFGSPWFVAIILLGAAVGAVVGLFHGGGP